MALIRSAGRAWGRAVLAVVAWALNAAVAAQQAPAAALPSLAIDGGMVTVSGVSSGGFMALQFAVAHSAMIRGVGVVAAGPYYCAQLDPARILAVCLKGRPDWRDSVAAVDFAAALGSIDSPSNLRTMRAWVLADGADPVVGHDVVEAAWKFLGHYSGERAHFEELAGAGHSMPTQGRGGACGLTQAPFLNDCGFDAAGHLLDDLYPGVPAGADGPGQLLRFDQSEFVSFWGRATGRASMARDGWIFVPDRCRDGACRLHVAFHGCRQGGNLAGQAFVRDAGYNEWARRHATVVLYPQVEPTAAPWYAPWAPVNGEGCWDWWGYTGADYAVRSAVQIDAVFRMIGRLMQGPPR